MPNPEYKSSYYKYFPQTYYQKNRERLLKQAKERYHKNKDIINEKQKKYFRDIYYPKKAYDIIHKRIFKLKHKPVIKNTPTLIVKF